MAALLKDKVALITGCNRGIGKAIMEKFAANGANIWACVRKENSIFSANIAKLKKEKNVDITPLYFDITDIEQMKKAVKIVRSSNKNVDILVNNAGVIFAALFQMTSMKTMQEMFEVNFYSQLQLTQYVTKIMVKYNFGSIINISSIVAIEANEGRIAYAASKAALITATKVMAKELAVNRIRVNAIAPGIICTDMMTKSIPKEVLQKTLARICMKRVGEPEEIANTALFLASEQASYITGQVIKVDGGM